MKLRVARHTKKLQPLIDFYTLIIGLEVLGEFKDHAGYDGVFIGNKNCDWHLEFTTSAEEPQHHADEDDLLVFYADSIEAHDQIIAKAKHTNVPQAEPKNPYWQQNGTLLLDPDGFGVMVVAQQ